MYDELAAFMTPPVPFSRYTTDLLWTDPHIAQQMLRFHLDPEVDAASRRPDAINALVTWLDARVGLAGKCVLDLGCGPGLYTEQMARRGASVTGLDFSPISLNHATASAARAGLGITYLLADYHKGNFPGPVDLATLIYGDYCAMSADRRTTFLGRVSAALSPGGRLVFDVYSPGQFAMFTEDQEFGRRLMGGFWAAGDYFGFRKTFRYEAEHISLDRYLVVAPGRRFEVFNWMQYFDPSTIEAELNAAGFAVEACLDITTGSDWVAGPTPFAVVARPT